MNQLYYGDNLSVLREHFPPESVDLVYLDPPFNSQRDYNLLFKSPKSHTSDAQITGFKDTWVWGPAAGREYQEILDQPNTQVTKMINAFMEFLGRNDMIAYLVMMAARMLELHRVLKPTGTLYLHCDPTASHYLRVLLDAVFGKENFRNEISWKRSQPKSHTKINFPNCRDVIFRYSKTESCIFNKVYSLHSGEYLKKFYRFEDEDGRKYQLADLTNPNKNRPNLTYEFLGIKRVWRWTRERMEKAWKDGLIVQARPGAVPRLKRYLDEMPGQPVTDDWNDIEHLHGSHGEYLGYPTQKPLALLERIIKTSSVEGDLVLDPFCGCGTTVHAAQKLNRRWIGIDITHLAVSLIEKRLRDSFPGTPFEVLGTPRDLEGARDLAKRDKYQFQWWACSLVEAQPYQGKKKGADSGIDGLIFFQDDDGPTKKIVVSVKGGESVTVAMMRDFAHVIEREKAALGFFITLAPPTRPMISEASGAGIYQSSTMRKSYPRLQILTIDGLLEGKERPQYPDFSRGGLTFKKAKTEHRTDEQEKLL